MSPPWMPLYVADYLADTMRLTTLEHGAYMLLIMEYWRNGGLPDDDRRIARIVGLQLDEWAAIRDNIADLFQPGWRHKRIDEEVERAGGRSNAAKAKADKRWHSKGDAGALPQQCQGNAISQSQSQIEASASIKSARTRSPIAFLRFWEVWPNKVGKPHAEKAFGPRHEAEIEAIIAGVLAYVRDKPPDRPWLNPSTFLNQERWKDNPAPVSPRDEGKSVHAAIKRVQQSLSRIGEPPPLLTVVGGGQGGPAPWGLPEGRG